MFRGGGRGYARAREVRAVKETVTPAAARQAADELQEMLKDGGLSPDEQAAALSDHALCRRLHVAPETLERGFTGEIEPGGEEVRRELERVIAMRQMLCIRSLTGGSPDSGWILLSRQPRWGGLSDGKGGERAPVTLEVRINGADGRPLRPERLLGGREGT